MSEKYRVVRTTTDHANIEADKVSDLSALYSNGIVDEVCSDAFHSTVKYSVWDSDGRLVFQTDAQGRVKMSEEKVVSVPDDKEVLELAKQVQANGWSVMHHILKQYYLNKRKDYEPNE